MFYSARRLIAILFLLRICIALALLPLFLSSKCVHPYIHITLTHRSLFKFPFLTRNIYEELHEFFTIFLIFVAKPQVLLFHRDQIDERGGDSGEV